jgi:hypothetical protein
LDFPRNFKRIACSDRKRDAPTPCFSPLTYPSSLLVNLVGAVLTNSLIRADLEGISPE